MADIAQLSFSIEEYRSRVARVQEKMTEVGIDALLCHDFANICYLTGLQSVMGPVKYFMAIVASESDPCLIVQDFEMHNVGLTSWVQDTVSFTIFGDPIQASGQALIDRGLADKRLGVEMRTRCLSPSEFERLRQTLPRARWVDVSDLVRSLRAIKSPAEIDCIRQAAKISSVAMKAAMEAAGEGKTDNDIAAAATEACFAAGSEFLCLQPIVSLGSRSGVPHCTFSRNPIKQGDLCFVEIGACIHRYSAPLIRTFSIGKPGPLELLICKEIQASLNTVVENLKPWIPVSRVAREARKAWSWTYSNRDLFWNGAYGYSVGLGFPSDWSDAPIYIRREEKGILQPGMVFHCTNNIRKGGVFGMGLSETVLITETGCEVLTEFPRHLILK